MNKITGSTSIGLLVAFAISLLFSAGISQASGTIQADSIIRPTFMSIENQAAAGDSSITNRVFTGISSFVSDTVGGAIRILSFGTLGNSGPTASLMVENTHEYTYSVGDTVHYRWSSKNSDSQTFYLTSNDSERCGAGSWIPELPSGTFSDVLGEIDRGCVWVISYEAKDTTNGQSASDSIKVTVGDRITPDEFASRRSLASTTASSTTNRASTTATSAKPVATPTVRATRVSPLPSIVPYYSVAPRPSTYYSPSPSAYYPIYTSPTPAYYYSSPSPTTYPVYYSPSLSPVISSSPYVSPTPYYYSPSPAVYISPSPTPTYYYVSPSPTPYTSPSPVISSPLPSPTPTTAVYTSPSPSPTVSVYSSPSAYLGSTPVQASIFDSVIDIVRSIW